jgi:hypothetical protein
MEILRIAENITSEGIAVTIQVPGSHSESDHILSIVDLSDLSISETTVETSGGEDLTFHLDKNFDSEYEVELFLDDEVIFSETYTVVRPYVNPNTLGTTASEITEYTKLERIARAIIDSVMEPVDFYNKKSIYEVTGNGLDLMPVWKDTNAVLRIYENNEIVYDVTNETNVFTYGVTKDKTAIYKLSTELENVIDTFGAYIPLSPTDYAYLNTRYGNFKIGNDFAFILDCGYKRLPTSIVDAATMLIDDLKCGRLDYYKKFVTSYNTDQYRIQFDKKMLEGTGNLVVDKILDKYAKSITRVGVL